MKEDEQQPERPAESEEATGPAVEERVADSEEDGLPIDSIPAPPGDAPEDAVAEDEEEVSRIGRILGLTLPSLAVAGGVGALEVLRSRFQRQRMFLPDRFPNGIWDPAPFGLEVEDVWFEAEGGVRLHGWWSPHPRARWTLLYCHGNTGSIAHQVEVLKLFRRLRASFFAFDYRGYGRSEGTPSEKGLCADVRSAFDHLTGELGIDPREIVLFGHSMGGAVAIDGALHRPAAGLVVQSSFTAIRDMARLRYPQLPVHLVARNHFRSIDKVGGLGLPKLFVHGGEDGSVPLDQGRALYEAAAAPKYWLEVPRANHNDIHLHGGGAYRRALLRFRDRCLEYGGASKVDGRVEPGPELLN